MPFNYLLTNLLVDVPAAVGAIFLDDEGETIECVTRHGDPYELKVEGAYHSIFARQIVDAGAALLGGPVGTYIMNGERLATLTQVLPGGYYIVLVMDRGGSHAMAKFFLQRAAQVISRELT